MTAGSSDDDKRIVLRMACARPMPDWLVLHLDYPDGRFAAFWANGLKLEHATAVAKGDYEGACSYIGQTKQDVLDWIESDEGRAE